MKEKSNFLYFVDQNWYKAALKVENQFRMIFKKFAFDKFIHDASSQDSDF